MKTKIIISRILRITIAGILLQTLYFKFTAHPDSVYIFSQLGVEPYGRIGLGIAEVISSILILLSRTKLLGTVLAFFIICGALMAHFLVIGIEIKGDGGGLLTLAFIVLVACIGLFFLHKNEFQKAISKLLIK